MFDHRARVTKSRQDSQVLIQISPQLMIRPAALQRQMVSLPQPEKGPAVQPYADGLVEIQIQYYPYPAIDIDFTDIPVRTLTDDEIEENGSLQYYNRVVAFHAGWTVQQLWERSFWHMLHEERPEHLDPRAESGLSRRFLKGDVQLAAGSRLGEHNLHGAVLRVDQAEAAPGEAARRLFSSEVVYQGVLYESDESEHPGSDDIKNGAALPLDYDAFQCLRLIQAAVEAPCDEVANVLDESGDDWSWYLAQDQSHQNLNDNRKAQEMLFDFSTGTTFSHKSTVCLSVLGLVVEANRLDVCELLLNRNLQFAHILPLRDSWLCRYLPPLHMAVACGHVGMCNMLLERGIGLQAVSFYGPGAMVVRANYLEDYDICDGADNAAEPTMAAQPCTWHVPHCRILSVI